MKIGKIEINNDDISKVIDEVNNIEVEKEKVTFNTQFGIQEVKINKSKKLEIKILSGTIENIKSKKSITVQGDIDGDVDSAGSVIAVNIGGAVDAGGSVTCADIGGDVDAGGSVTAVNIDGDVDAGGSIRCTTMKGNISL